MAISQLMRWKLLVVAIAACGGSHGGPHPTATITAPGYTATRWIPAHPTYALAAHTIRDAQRAAADLFGSLGVVLDVDLSQVSRELARVMAVDPFAPDALSAIGIDLDGGFAMFSESLAPTLVVHLSSPDQLEAFFRQQRELGMKSESVMVGNVEVFSARISSSAHISWAVDDDWLWVHFGLPFDHQPGAEWFEESRHPSNPSWGDDWNHAATASPRLAGFVDVRALLGKLPKLGDALACAQLFAPVSRLAFAIDGNRTHAGLRLSVDVGAVSAGIRKAILPAPDGWDGAASQAPLAAQWNVDLPVVQKTIAPCVKLVGIDPSSYDSYGVRTARVMLMSFDPDDKKNSTGAVALDLASTTFVRSLLADIPLRSTLESSKTFGPYAGRSLSVPFGPTVEYVLTDSMALAAVGEGVLARVVGRGPGTANGKLFGIDVHPSALSAEGWESVFELAHIPGRRHAVDQLRRWHDLHASVVLDRTQLVFEVQGDRSQQ